MIQTRISKDHFSYSFTMQQWLIVSCCFSCLLLAARIVTTGYATYFFLIWNLFLAFVPYAISNWLFGNLAVMQNKWKLALSLAVWLLFIPNSFYILTDLFHLDRFTAAPKWFDLLMLLSFAWNGLLLGVVSLRRIELLMYTLRGRSFSLFIVFAVMFLNAFGIYIGRFLRYNSWDVIAQPFALFGEMFELLLHPLSNTMEWGMISSYAVFMTLIYITISKLSGNFNHPGRSFNQNQ